MVQKLPSSLYKKVLSEHQLASIRHKFTVAEDKIELHQQIASAENLPKYIDACKFLTKRKENLRLRVHSYSDPEYHWSPCSDAEHQGYIYSWPSQVLALCVGEADQVEDSQIIIYLFPSHPLSIFLSICTISIPSRATVFSFSFFSFPRINNNNWLLHLPFSCTHTLTHTHTHTQTHTHTHTHTLQTYVHTERVSQSERTELTH